MLSDLHPQLLRVVRLVHWCPSLSAVILTQLVTHAAFFSGMLSGVFSLIPYPLSIGG